MAKLAALEDKSLIRRRWAVLFSMALALLCCGYYFSAQGSEIHGGAPFGMWCGILGISSILFLSSYKARKGMYRFRLGTMQNWFKAHIYVGLISVVLVLMHSGFKMTGAFSKVLLVLFLLAIASGIIGSLIYANVPLSLSKYEREAKANEELLADLERYLVEADKSMSGVSNEFKDIYEKRIRPFFESGRTKWKYLLLEEQELLDKRKAMFEDFRKLVPSKEIYTLDILKSLLAEKEKLAYKWTKLMALRSWLNFHLPLASAMLTAFVFHLLSIAYY